MEPFAFFYHSVFDYTYVPCDISHMRRGPKFSYSPFQGGSSVAVLLCLCVCGFQIWCLCCPYFITKTCLYNNPHKHHFFIVKPGFIGVYVIFHISAQNIDCGYSLEPPRRGGSNQYTQSICVLSRNMKNIRICILKIFIFWR